MSLQFVMQNAGAQGPPAFEFYEAIETPDQFWPAARARRQEPVGASRRLAAAAIS